MSRWIRIATEDEVVPGQGRALAVGDLRIALFNHDGAYYAIDDDCPHQGASLGEGAFFDGRVICPRHAWVFDVRTGRCPRDTHEPVETYPTRRHAGAIEVELPPDTGLRTESP